MRQEIEIEFKNLLTQQEFEKLKHVFFTESAIPVTQENYYFDTKDFKLKQVRCALRIRMKEEAAEMTLKTPFEGHHTETTLDLSIDQAKGLIAMGSFPLPEAIRTVLVKEDILIDQDVSEVGRLKTERLEVEKPHSLIVLDKSYYANTIDYELEIESDSKSVGEEFFTQLLMEHAIPKRNTPNKIARAFKAGHSE
ncbi:MAG: CYTH domain-containing protein [Alkalibacterium sp.]